MVLRSISCVQRYIVGNISDNPLRNERNMKKMATLLDNVVKNVEFCRKILIPIHGSAHWHLMEVNFEDKEFRDYNSLRDMKKDHEVARLVRLQYL